jgi:predicted nucleotide-binding protein (sugar kinase/HSP70/actin superfamily)
MTSPVGQRMKVTKHGSLLFICPALSSNPETCHSTILRVVRMTLLLHHFLLHSKFHLFVTSLQMIGKQFFLWRREADDVWNIWIGFKQLEKRKADISENTSFTLSPAKPIHV